MNTDHDALKQHLRTQAEAFDLLGQDDVNARRLSAQIGRALQPSPRHKPRKRFVARIGLGLAAAALLAVPLVWHNSQHSLHHAPTAVPIALEAWRQWPQAAEASLLADMQAEQQALREDLHTLRAQFNL